MSRVIKVRQTEPRAEKYTAEVMCDLCGAIAPSPSNYDPWEKMYDVARPRVSLKTGSMFPEGGSGELTFFDICPECFVSKVIPALRALGATPTVESWDT